MLLLFSSQSKCNFLLLLWHLLWEFTCEKNINNFSIYPLIFFCYCAIISMLSATSADIAQSVERILGKDEVTSSNLVISFLRPAFAGLFFVRIIWDMQNQFGIKITVYTNLNLKRLQNSLMPCDTANDFRHHGPDRAAQSFDHFFKRLEHFIAEASDVSFTPNLLNGVHFGRVWRNVNHMDVIRYKQRTRFVPCSAIAE